MEELIGEIEDVLFINQENGFTVAKILDSITKEKKTIVGNLFSIKKGEQITCKGEWKSHPSYGKQFEVASFEIKTPSDLIGIQKYLESGLIKGIGPTFAKRIVDHFGLSTLDVLDHSPSLLKKVEGIGKKRVQMIISSLEGQKAIRNVMIFLRSHGISHAYAQKIYKNYGDKSIEIVKENPFKLAEEIRGIGFKLADSIAQKIGFEKTSKKRLKAGILHLLFEQSLEGHTSFREDLFIEYSSKMLEVETSLIQKTIDDLLIEKNLIRENQQDGENSRAFLWTSFMFQLEKGIAKELLRLKKSSSLLREIKIDKALTWVEEKLKIKLAKNQKEAVEKALLEKITIITGGPGTGKSTITSAILTIMSKITSKIILAAPTGRAAKRLKEITKKHAHTIHSLLEVDFITGNFKRNRQNPLLVDLIIIDEASMIDTELFYHLLLALPSEARLILIGDVDQLPSVGPGRVLKDLIESNLFPVIFLKEIFRQKKDSLIIQNAHKINNGEFPIIPKKNEGDFLFFEIEETENIARKILSLIQKELPQKGFNPIDDIQLLTPMKKGPIGSESLNLLLQNALNPSKDPLLRGFQRFHVKDKIMQIRNNYKKFVFNGDIGIIQHIDRNKEELSILYDHREVKYEFSELDEITLAYSVSVHKFQGSESLAVIIPIHMSHFKLLFRNLLYTAVTRGKKLVVLVGSKKAIALAIKNSEVSKRYTGLKEILIHEAKKTTLFLV